jgi:hypothetical protein
MFNRSANGERSMSTGRFIAVERPSPAEGVGRALQVAYREGCDLPGELRCYLDRLNRIRA